MLRALAQRPDQAVHLLGGLGGTGKTTIALQIADERLSAGCDVWWVSGAEAHSLFSDLMSLAQSLGATAQDVEAVSQGRRDPADLLWRFLESRNGWLLVIDNVDDPHTLSRHGRAVQDNSGWIRPTSAGLILVTSRNSDPLAWGRHVTPHTVGWLPAEQGARILCDFAPRAGSFQEARDLSDRLGGLPLALHHAGLHLTSPFNPERSFTSYAQALTERFPQLMAVGADDRSIVRSTWRLTLDALVANGHPSAGAQMRVLARLAGGVPFPCELLDHEVFARGCGLDDGTRSAAGLRALAHTGLITLGSSGSGAETLTVHPLVVEILRLDDDEPDRHENVCLDLLAAAVARLEFRNPEHSPAWSSFLPHLAELLQAKASHGDDPSLAQAAEVAEKIAAALGWNSRYFTASQLIEETLKATARLGDEHPVVLSLRLVQAQTTRLLGDPGSAERIVREVLVFRERSLGADGPGTLATRHELGLCLAGQGKTATAEEQYREVIRRRHATLGADHPDTLIARAVLAHLHSRTSELLDEAERECRDVHADQSRILGSDHPDTLVTRKRIAAVLHRQGRLTAAEDEYQAVLPGLVRGFGVEHGHVLSTRYELAKILLERGRRRTARKRLEELGPIQRRVLGTDHPGTLKTERALAELRSAG
ncbi:tetratricopeptide repeat protein [Actinocorallia herbida]|uniref:Tetratricopeptide repeat protein n=1 Tax=Actinocorallia herbida TaxID=58109 RepID=A0A3N1CY53_9ACTN|nr:tetratricopeptide repeat protein [Actinocorallia herbida]